MQQQWQGKSKGNKHGYSIFIKTLKTLGILPAYFLLIFVAFYYFLFSGKSTQHLWYYYRERQQSSILKSIISIYANYFWFGQALIDRIVMMSGIKNKFSFHFDGEEHLHQMVAEGKGGILLSAHLGNWEIAGHLLERLNTPIHIVMFDGEHQQLKNYLETTTGKRKAHIIVIKNDISHIYEIMEALNRNELVCMHADRFITGNKTLKATLLGKDALFPAGPFALGTKLNVPVSFVFAVKENLRHYHFFASKAKNYKQLKTHNTAQYMLDEFAQLLTQKATKYPRQWYNYYNFWKK